MTPFVHTPSFTASCPDVDNGATNSPAASTNHSAASAPSDSELATTGAPAHTAANAHMVRPILHLPARKQGVARRSWPFVGIPSH